MLSERVELPVTNPTCPAFGGDDLATLYVTTARHRLAPEQERAELAAGVRARARARCARAAVGRLRGLSHSGGHSTLT